MKCKRSPICLSRFFFFALATGVARTEYENATKTHCIMFSGRWILWNNNVAADLVPSQPWKVSLIEAIKMPTYDMSIESSFFIFPEIAYAHMRQ